MELGRELRFYSSVASASQECHLATGPPLQRALLESAQDVPSQRGTWQAAPFVWDVRRRLFHGFCGACGEESWDRKCSCSESLCSTGRRPGMGLCFSGYYTP